MSNVKNEYIASLFDELAELVLKEDSSANTYKAKAYRTVALALAAEKRDLDTFNIMTLPGVGKSSKEKVDEYFKIGKILLLEQLREKHGVRAKSDKTGERIEWYRDWETDRKSTRLNSSHSGESRMPSSA